MNMISFLTQSYGNLKNYGMPFWVMTPLRRLVRSLSGIVLPSYLSSKYNYKKNSIKEGIIVSLTSFPGRIDIVWMAIESIKRQSILPEKIYLWLFKDQFPNRESIPESLWSREDEIFEIKFVDDNIRSHTKYYYAFLNYPDKTIVTCDDDIIYDPDMIKRLVDTSILYPDCIIANHTTHIHFNENGDVVPYLQWSDGYPPLATENRLQLGEAGVLYPPHCMPELLLRKDLFMKLSPLADDIWLNSMSRLKKTPVVQTKKQMVLLPIRNEAPALCSLNNGEENMNDKQINNIREYLRKNKLEDVYCSECYVAFHGNK